MPAELAPDKLADITVVNMKDDPRFRPLHRVVANLVYAATPSDVEMTIVGGEIIVENGHCTKINEADVSSKKQKTGHASWLRERDSNRCVRLGEGVAEIRSRFGSALIRYRRQRGSGVSCQAPRLGIVPYHIQC